MESSRWRPSDRKSVFLSFRHEQQRHSNGYRVHQFDGTSINYVRPNSKQLEVEIRSWRVLKGMTYLSAYAQAITTKFLRIYLCFRSPAVQRNQWKWCTTIESIYTSVYTLYGTTKPQETGSKKLKMAVFKLEMPMIVYFWLEHTIFLLISVHDGPRLTHSPATRSIFSGHLWDSFLESIQPPAHQRDLKWSVWNCRNLLWPVMSAVTNSKHFLVTRYNKYQTKQLHTNTHALILLHTQ